MCFVLFSENFPASCRSLRCYALSLSMSKRPARFLSFFNYLPGRPQESAKPPLQKKVPAQPGWVEEKVPYPLSIGRPARYWDCYKRLCGAQAPGSGQKDSGGTPEIQAHGSRSIRPNAVIRVRMGNGFSGNYRSGAPGDCHRDSRPRGIRDLQEMFAAAKHGDWKL